MNKFFTLCAVVVAVLFSTFFNNSVAAAAEHYYAVFCPTIEVFSQGEVSMLHWAGSNYVFEIKTDGGRLSLKFIAALRNQKCVIFKNAKSDSSEDWKKKAYAYRVIEFSEKIVKAYRANKNGVMERVFFDSAYAAKNPASFKVLFPKQPDINDDWEGWVYTKKK